MRTRREALRFLRSPVPAVVSFDESERLGEVARNANAEAAVELLSHRIGVDFFNRSQGAPIERRKGH